MQLESQQYVSDLLSTQKTAAPDFTTDDFERTEQYFDHLCSQLVDVHSKYRVRICYLRVASGDIATKVCISSSGTVNQVLEGNRFGVLLKVNYEEQQYTVWLPPTPAQYGNPTQSSPRETLVWLPSGPEAFSFDKHKRISTRCASSVGSYQWQFQPNIQLTVFPPSQVGEVAVFPYVVMEDPDGQLFEELSVLTDEETRLYRKTNWFYPRKPADVWNYLIDGSLYDPRFLEGVNKRFKCQQCAYAWWNYFDFLHKQTSKKIYTVLQDEVAYSVLLDMSENGEWGHGFWSDDIETHTRFHLDGLHLLISQYEKTGNPIWLEAAKKGMDFVSEHITEKLDDDGIWYLHDTVEHSRLHYFKSTLFGKTPNNSLCINTHVQALTVLHRLHAIAPEEKTYGEMFEKGVKALQKALTYQPAEALYRPLMTWVLKYQTTKKPRSKKDKLVKYAQAPIILLFYWAVRSLFPRIVQPNGFIERDIDLSFASDWYHIINLKDLLTLYQQEPLPWLVPCITNGVSLVRQLNLADALERKLHYIEWIDALYMYSKLIEKVSPEEIESVEKIIHQKTGGYSLDYYASGLVRGFDKRADCASSGSPEKRSLVRSSEEL